MTHDQIARVRASWGLVLPVAPTFASLCYERLFALDPSLRDLFARADVGALERKLVHTLAMIVAGIDDLRQLAPAIELLGRRHVGLGVTGAHYRSMRDAILWTLGRALGDGFDADTRRAWEVAYDALVAAMNPGPGRDSASDAAIATTVRVP